MQIRPAGQNDIPAILEIIESARQVMRETGNTGQWGHGYPSQSVIECDINANYGFVCETEGEAVGYFCLMIGLDIDPNYFVIESGRWLNEEPYGVIHRLASSRKAKGIAKAAFDFAFSKIQNIRVDTHRDNLPMQNFLKKSGFTYCGTVYVGDGTARDAFQKVQM